MHAKCLLMQVAQPPCNRNHNLQSPLIPAEFGTV
jgi:hypothetical protein